LRCVIEVAYMFASVNAKEIVVWKDNTQKRKTTRKELQPHELTSKVTTEFAYNGTSRGLHKERYCRMTL